MSCTVNIEQWCAGDELQLDLCEQQARDFIGPDLGTAIRTLVRQGSAFSLRSIGGRLLAIAGVATIDPGFGHCWAFQSRYSGPHMVALTRRVRSYLDTVQPRYRRLEMVVRADFPEAAIWALLLGFKDEGVMTCAAPDGTDMIRFARINRHAIDRRAAL